MANYLEILNEPQRAAVLHKEGPLMIIAGAGSGKTRVLTYRIAHLMQLGIDPFNILALTFTNKAAREMKERIAKVAGSAETKNLWMGTFHSIFARILRSEADKLGFSKNFVIYDTQDSQRLIATIIKEMSLDKDTYKPRKVASRISTYKNNLITVRAYFNNPELIEADRYMQRPKMGDIYKEYVDRCFKADAMDFDDLLLRTNELLAKFPQVLAAYQDRFRYILIDEYQDTNHSQYIIIRALADRHQNICVVGDDSQSIYGFRGANIQNILNFKKDYPDATVYKLEQNYRSTKNIVLAANSVIKKNRVKLDKNLWTQNAEGEKILVKELGSDRDEGRFIADKVLQIHRETDTPLSEFAVLYRTNAQSRSIEDAFRNKGVQYRIYGGLSFYQRKEIKDVLAYLRLLVNSADEEAFKRIINYPPRGIGATTMDKLSVLAKQTGETLFGLTGKEEYTGQVLNAGTRNKLREFRNMIESLRIYAGTHNAFETAKELIHRTRIIKHLESSGDMEDAIRIENIQELLNGIYDFTEQQEQLPDADLSLDAFLQDVALATDFDRESEGDDVVSLMTVHLSKGLEFPNVFIAGMEEGLFPSAMSMSTREDLEEERRLFYVALTRAEKRAFLLYAQSRYRWGKFTVSEPSRFLDEIDEQYVIHEEIPESSYGSGLLDSSLFEDSPPPSKNKIRFQKPRSKKEFRKGKKLKPVSELSSSAQQTEIPVLKPGDRVEHAHFGKGKVLQMEGTGSETKAVILFDTAGERKLLLRFAKLKVL